jgi:hypothetical protein
MASIKPIIYLVLVIIVAGTVGLSYTDEGFFTFKSKAKAEAIIAEAKDINRASEAYSAGFGDGTVDYGDLTLGEDLFLYLKDKELLVKRAGISDSGNIVGWRIAEDGETLQGVVENDQICRYINLTAHERRLSEDTPECETLEAEGLSCCSEAP